MIRMLLLVLTLLLAVPAAAHAQKDKMALGEALGAVVKRGFGAAAPQPTATTTPAAQDRLTTTEQLTPTKGAR